MKFLIALLSILILMGCCTACPPEDIVVMLMTPMGPAPYLFEKGTFDKKQDYVMTKPDFDKYLEDMGNELERQLRQDDEDSGTMKL